MSFSLEEMKNRKGKASVFTMPNRGTYMLHQTVQEKLNRYFKKIIGISMRFLHMSI